MEAELRTVVLIGLPGSGKTSIGRKLSVGLGTSFIDCDQEIERLAGMAVPQIFSRFGEAHFRKLESDLLSGLLKGQGQGHPAKPGSELRLQASRSTVLVLSTGGGMPVGPGNFDLLKALGTTIYLKTEPSVLAGRLFLSKSRPLLQVVSNDFDALVGKLTELQSVREPIYSQADHVLETTNLSEDEVLLLLLTRLNDRRARKES